MNPSPLHRVLRAASVLTAGMLAGVLLTPTVRSQSPPPGSYRVVTADGTRATLPARAAGNTDLVPLADVATMFGLAVREDPVTGGVTLSARGQRIVLTSGQALASVGGRVVSLSGAVVRDGRNWLVPIDLLSRAIGPALSVRMDVRRGSRLVIIGDARVPQVGVRVERQGTSGRVTIDVQPPTAHRVTRDGGRLLVTFEADALDAGAPGGTAPEFVANVHADAATLVIDLGPLATSFRVTEDRDPSRFVIDLIAPGAPATAAPRPAAPQEPPPVDLSAPAGPVRTVVIDPGHGGDDTGVHGASGAVEKDLTLQVARRLKASIESRIGLRVLLTRDTDDNVPVDKRTAFANNNQADLLVSLHANASFRPSVRGVQVLSLSLDDYKRRAQALASTGAPVPVVGGATRLIEAVPWELAQIPHAAASASLGALVVRHLTEQNVLLYKRPADMAPLRILAGANMPAVLVEMGFLTNADDERALASDDLVTAIVSAIVSTIIDVRGGAIAKDGATGPRHP